MRLFAWITCLRRGHTWVYMVPNFVRGKRSLGPLEHKARVCSMCGKREIW